MDIFDEKSLSDESIIVEWNENRFDGGRVVSTDRHISGIGGGSPSSSSIDGNEVIACGRKAMESSSLEGRFEFRDFVFNVFS